MTSCFPLAPQPGRLSSKPRLVLGPRLNYKPVGDGAFAVGEKLRMPTVRLENGLVVANFSSPHPFTFDDGSVLPGCDPARVEAMSLRRVDREEPDGLRPIVNVVSGFDLTNAVREAVEDIQQEWPGGGIDVVLIPFPMRDPLLRWLGAEDLTQAEPFRLCLLKDRQTKVVYSDRFGV